MGKYSQTPDDHTQKILNKKKGADDNLEPRNSRNPYRLRLFVAAYFDYLCSKASVTADPLRNTILQSKAFDQIIFFTFLATSQKNGKEPPLVWSLGQVICRQTHHLYFSRTRRGVYCKGSQSRREIC